MNDNRISSFQFTILVIVFSIGSAILFTPSILTMHSKQDAWLSAILTAGAGAALSWFYGKVGRSFPGCSPVQACEQALGPWLGKLAALWYCLFSLILAALVLRNMGDFIVTAILHETPIEMVHVLFLAVVVLAVRAGPGTIARVGEIFFPWIVMFVLVLVVLLLPKAELQHAFPVGESGIRGILRGMYAFIGIPFLELVVLLSVFQYLPIGSQKNGGFVIGVVISGLVLTIIVALSVTVLGADLTSRQTYPSYVLARQINVGNFLERMESIMAGLWFITVFFKVTLCYYAASLGFSQLLKLADYKTVTLPIAMIVLVLSIIAYPNSSYSISVISELWTAYACSVGLALPLLLWGVSSFRGRKKQGG